MNRIGFIMVALLISFSALGQGHNQGESSKQLDAELDENRGEFLRSIEQRMGHLEAAKKCAAAAQDGAALNECRRKLQIEAMEMKHEQRRDQRMERRKDKPRKNQ